MKEREGDKHNKPIHTVKYCIIRNGTHTKVVVFCTNKTNVLSIYEVTFERPPASTNTEREIGKAYTYNTFFDIVISDLLAKL